jgi:hypothetical protein
MMGVDDSCTTQRTHQTWREGMRGMAPHPTQGAQRADPQSTRLLHHTAMPTKRDQLTLDMSHQSSRQLEWIALTTAE